MMSPNDLARLVASALWELSLRAAVRPLGASINVVSPAEIQFGGDHPDPDRRFSLAPLFQGLIGLARTEAAPSPAYPPLPLASARPRAFRVDLGTFANALLLLRQVYGVYGQDGLRTFWKVALESYLEGEGYHGATVNVEDLAGSWPIFSVEGEEKEKTKYLAESFVTLLMDKGVGG